MSASSRHLRTGLRKFDARSPGFGSWILPRLPESPESTPGLILFEIDEQLRMILSATMALYIYKSYRRHHLSIELRYEKVCGAQ